MRGQILLVVFLGMFLPFAGGAYAEECRDCHKKVTPGIVGQWEAGKMSKHFSCDACHGKEHRTMDDYEKAGFPTPETCKACHVQQYEQFMEGKHSLAWIAMRAMPMIAHQPTPVVGEGFKGCSGCHKIGIKPEEDLREFKRGYGTGSCDSCHTRHKFSKEEALDPRACQTCHMGFDHPQWEMWSTSKHGTVWQIEKALPDGDPTRAPKCQTCHMKDGDHAVITPWGFLALRVPEDDEEWWKDRVTILQALGVLDEKGNPTQRFELVKAGKVARLSKEEFQEIRREYVEACGQCHSSGFVEQHFNSCDEIIRETDRLLAEGIQEVKDLYDEGLLSKPVGWEFAPDLLQFYEAATPIEQELYLMFLEYRMRAFQGCFHANPDYMHWYGWAEMKKALTDIKTEAARMREEAPKEKPPKKTVCGPTLMVMLAVAPMVLRRLLKL
jgi:hypothetical protein